MTLLAVASSAVGVSQVSVKAASLAEVAPGTSLCTCSAGLPFCRKGCEAGLCLQTAGNENLDQGHDREDRRGLGLQNLRSGIKGAERRGSEVKRMSCFCRGPLRNSQPPVTPALEYLTQPPDFLGHTTQAHVHIHN